MNVIMNITSIVKNGLCTGCGTCIIFCRQSAIELVKNEERGIYLPKLKKEMCIQCGVCLRICPGYEVDFKQLNQAIFNNEPANSMLGNYICCAQAWVRDNSIRENSSSGGTVSALLIHALKKGVINGALVTRMKKDSPLEPEPFIAKTREEIIEAAKSKYCPVPANIGLEYILASEGKYAIVGLPCHIHAIRKAEQLDERLKEKILFHIGIFCGTNKTFLGTEYIIKCLKLKKEDVLKIEYRGEGWPGNMIIHLKNGRKIITKYSNYYRCLYPFINKRCMLCTDLSAELADASFGDAWTLDKDLTKFASTSVIIVRKKNVEKILQEMLEEEEVEVAPVPAQKISLQQGFMRKKRDIKAIFNLQKIVRREIPIYNTKLHKPTIRAYFIGIIFYMQNFFAQRPKLWFILKIYHSLKGYL